METVTIKCNVINDVYFQQQMEKKINAHKTETMKIIVTRYKNMQIYNNKGKTSFTVQISW